MIDAEQPAPGMWVTVILSHNSPKMQRIIETETEHVIDEVVQLNGARLLVMHGRVNVFNEIRLYCDSRDVKWMSGSGYRELLRVLNRFSTWGQIYTHFSGG